MSRIVTFYSYKGGVGRTLALANIGILLARRGKKVLLMDWDLEAPGLDRYFRPHQTTDSPTNQGVVHLLHQAATDPRADWRPHLQTVRVRVNGDKEDCVLHLIPSGVAAPDYSDLVRHFSWDTFLGEQGGGEVLERWRSEWKADFDLVLIDSRTGITDSGGICTILLPDFLVLVFTANDQSFEGTLAIAASAQAGRRELAVQRPPLMFLPLLSRFDRRDELAEADKWLARFADGLMPLYADWLPTQFKSAQILEVTKIPYVTRFSFGEPLPVLTHSLTDPELPGYYLVQCARLLESDFNAVTQILKGDSDSQGDEGIGIGLPSPRQAISLYERTLNNARRNGDRQDEADALVHLGNAYWALGEPQQAAKYYEDSVNLYRQSGDRANAGSLFAKLGLAYSAMGEVAKAIGYHEQALAIARELGDRPAEGAALGNLGNAWSALGEPREAIEVYEQGLTITRMIGDRRGEGATLGNLGNAYARLGKVEKAIGAYEKALLIAREIGDRRGEGVALGNLGNAYARLGEVEKARALLQQARSIGEQIGDPPITQGTLAALARLQPPADAKSPGLLRRISDALSRRR